MKKEPSKPAEPERYSDVAAALEQIVEELEAGALPLEQSLERFAEGIRLVRRGEQLLSDAEQRIELLLNASGEATPLSEGTAAAKPPGRSSRKTRDDEDVAF